MNKLKRKTVFLRSWSRVFIDTSVSGCLSLPTASFSLPVTLPGHLREAQLPITVHVEHPQLPGHKRHPVTHRHLLPSLPPAVGWRDPLRLGAGPAPPQESCDPPGPAQRSHLRWSACTPAAWAHHRAGSPSSAGPTRSPGRREGFAGCPHPWLSQRGCPTSRDPAQPTPCPQPTLSSLASM